MEKSSLSGSSSLPTEEPPTKTMAMMCSESPSLGTSPRISFSHDLHHPQDDLPSPLFRSDPPFILDSDFNFCVAAVDSDPEPSSADELFSGGLILPQGRFPPPPKPAASSSLPLSPPSCSKSSSKQQNFKKITADGSENESNQAPEALAAPTKSFWRFRRSSSLHSDNSYKKSSFWSITLLLRSNSTGSDPITINAKLSSKESNHKKYCASHKQQRFSGSSPSSSSSSANLNLYSFSQKPPLKKKNHGGGSYGGGVRTSPVLNVPPPYISIGTTHFLGLGSLFRNGKEKKNKAK